MSMPVYRILMSSGDDSRSECKRASEVVRRVGEDYHEEIKLELLFHRNGNGLTNSFSIETHQTFDLVVCLIDRQHKGADAELEATGTQTNGSSDSGSPTFCYLQRRPKLLANPGPSDSEKATPVGTHSNVFYKIGREMALIVRVTLAPASIAIEIPKSLSGHWSECCARSAVNAQRNQWSSMFSREEKR
jgi:hypothetical protein